MAGHWLRKTSLKRETGRSAEFSEGFATADLNEAKILLVVEGDSEVEASTLPAQADAPGCHRASAHKRSEIRRRSAERR
jgi:hypothetical protein